MNSSRYCPNHPISLRSVDFTAWPFLKPCPTCLKCTSDYCLLFRYNALSACPLTINKGLCIKLNIFEAHSISNTNLGFFKAVDINYVG